MKRSRIVVVASVALLSFCAAASAQLKGAEPPATPAAPAAPSIEQTEKFLYLVDHFARLSENPTSTAIGAVLQAADIMKDKPQDAINYFNNALPDVKNEAVRRVIRLQLADLYQRTNQPDKALEQLREVMILAPAGTTHTTKTGAASGRSSGSSAKRAE